MAYLPLPAQRAVRKLGADVDIARRKRRMTESNLAERAGISLSTYRKIKAGDATVAFGNVVAVLVILGLENRVSALADAETDDVGLALDEEALPKRVRD